MMRKAVLLLLVLVFSGPVFAARVGNFTADEPFRAYLAVTPSDTATYGIPGATNPRPIEALYVGGPTTPGNLVLVGQDGVTATFNNVPAGTILLVSPLKVAATSTTSTNIIALYR